jgi:outer membrane protein assembly factor BamB
MRYCVAILVSVVACLGANRLSAAEPDTLKTDTQTLKEANLSPEGPALLDYFRRRTVPDADRVKIQELIKQLGDDTFQVRENASDQLVAIGAPAVSFLTKAKSDEDVEVARRAEQCLKLIEKSAGPAVTTAALRVLAHRKPAGTAEVLLNFLPFADDETVADEVRHSLTAVAAVDGKPDKNVEAALEDKSPVRRAAAVQALVRAGNAEQRTAFHKYLKDSDANVRLQAALAFFDQKDNASVPVLIDLLTQLPANRLWQVEDDLFLIAGEQAPNVSLGGSEAQRREARTAWQTWWEKDGKKIDLAKLDLTDRLLGRTLITEVAGRLNGRVYEVGKDGKVIWEIGNLNFPMDAQMVGSDRVLVTEYRARLVTERDLKGEVKWQKMTPNLPVSAQRLPDGNTLICCRVQILEVDKDGKEVVTLNRPDAIAARKRRDGNYVLLTNLGKVVQVDATGKEIKSFALEGAVGRGIGTHFDLLPNGRVVVPNILQGKVQEYDEDGKKVWEATVQAPTSVVRLPNGHTLVASSGQSRVVELDREGKEVWEHKTEGRVMAVRRR